MKHWLLITVVLIVLCGCQTMAGNVATNIALESLLRPVADQVVKGGKSAFAAASEVWQELTSQDNKPNEEAIINHPSPPN